MKSLSFAIISLIFISSVPQTDFLTEQKKYGRVRTAIAEKQSTIENSLKENTLAINDFNLLLIAYKDNDELELYTKKKSATAYLKIKTYEVCARSGQLGPKRKQGDYQVPEGFYHIDRFNPSSNFYLSLGLNYPNLADKRKSTAPNLGGDIFIHGNCVTIGCLPMTDDKIKEIYLYAVHAKNNGQVKIPVYVFPFKMTDQNMELYKVEYKNDKDLLDFWTNLKSGYDKFMLDKKELRVSVSSDGDYLF